MAEDDTQRIINTQYIMDAFPDWTGYKSYMAEENGRYRDERAKHAYRAGFRAAAALSARLLAAYRSDICDWRQAIQYVVDHIRSISLDTGLSPEAQNETIPLPLIISVNVDGSGTVFRGRNLLYAFNKANDLAEWLAEYQLQDVDTSDF